MDIANESIRQELWLERELGRALFSQEDLEESWGIEPGEVHEVHALLFPHSHSANRKLAILTRECSRGVVYWKLDEITTLEEQDDPRTELLDTPVNEWWSNSENEYIRFAIVIDPLTRTVKSVFDQGIAAGTLRCAAPEREMLMEVLGFAAS